MMRLPSAVNLLTIPILLGAMSFVPGCGKSNDDESDKPLPKSGSVPVTKHAANDWEPDPEWRSLMTQTAAAGPYQISLTPEFQAVESTRTLPENMKLYTWKGVSKDGSQPPALTMAVRFKDPKLLGEATKDLQNVLMSFTASQTDPAGIMRSGFPSLQTGPIGKIEFSRARWFGVTRDRVKVAGGDLRRRRRHQCDCHPRPRLWTQRRRIAKDVGILHHKFEKEVGSRIHWRALQ